MKFKELSLEDIEQVRQWRNQQLSMLRTSFPLTKEMQADFYHNVVCNRQANSRYWGIWEDDFIGMAGIENIQWENRLGEISLILDPEYQDRAEQALRLILNEGFNDLNLENIYTEVYCCSPHFDFWMTNELNADKVVLPKRKYWDGTYYDSLYINFNKEQYHENTIS